MKKKTNFTLIFKLINNESIAFKEGEKTPFSGIYEEHDKKSSYKNGKLDGIYLEYDIIMPAPDPNRRLRYHLRRSAGERIKKGKSTKEMELKKNPDVFKYFPLKVKKAKTFLKLKRFYKNGQLNGISEKYYPGSSVREKMSTYKNGKLDGISEIYMVIKGEEKLYSSVSYKNDKREGFFKTYFVKGFNTNSNTNYKSGEKLSSISEYKNNKENGASKSYYENGKLGSISKYKNGKRVGTYKVYYENGQLEEVENYKNGRIEGIRKIYYENGQISRTCSYKKGERNGVVKDYHENGQLSRVGVQKNDLYNGNVKSYYENGQLKTISFWKKTQLGQSEVIVEKYNDDGTPDKILSKSNLNIPSKKKTSSKDLPKYYFPKRPNSLKIYHPTKDYKKDISTAKFYGGTKYNYPSVIHRYNNHIYNNNSKSKKSVEYNFKKIETIAENFVWTFSMAGESVNSYYLETTKDHYLLWETYRSEDEDMGSLYDIKEGDDEYDSYPEFYELKCLCKKNILSKKDTAILLLFDHWKDSSKETFPDEFGDLGELLSMEEITIIFDHIKASK